MAFAADTRKKSLIENLKPKIDLSSNFKNFENSKKIRKLSKPKNSTIMANFQQYIPGTKNKIYCNHFFLSKNNLKQNFSHK